MQMKNFFLSIKKLLKEVFVELGYTKENIRNKTKKWLKRIIRNFIAIATGFVSGCGASQTEVVQDKFHYEIVRDSNSSFFSKEKQQPFIQEKLEPESEESIVPTESTSCVCEVNKRKANREGEGHSYVQTTYPISGESYDLEYNGATKTAYWVYEKITKDSLEKNCERKGIAFAPDPEIPDIVKSTLKDYQGSGFDRGHLCPAGDRTYSCEALKETFYLSNMSPQLPGFNRGYWKKFEDYTRKLVNQHNIIHVFTIPLFLPEEDDEGKFVHYKVIGQNDIAVPTHFAKVIFTSNDYSVFILPHKNIESKTNLESFKTTLEDLEKKSGLIFSREKLLLKNYEEEKKDLRIEEKRESIKEPEQIFLEEEINLKK